MNDCKVCNDPANPFFGTCPHGPGMRSGIVNGEIIQDERPYLCPKCEGMTTESKRNPHLFPTDLLCPTCEGTGVVWK
jgi:DnaJ-class molecular chaperone